VSLSKEMLFDKFDTFIIQLRSTSGHLVLK